MVIHSLAILNLQRAQRILKTWIKKKVDSRLIALWTELKCFSDVEQMEKSLDSRAGRDFGVIMSRSSLTGKSLKALCVTNGILDLPKVAELVLC